MELSSLEARILRFIFSQPDEKCELRQLRAEFLPMSPHLIEFHLSGLVLTGLVEADGKSVQATEGGRRLRDQIPEEGPILHTLTVRV